MARAQGRRLALEEVVAVDVGSRYTKAVHLRRKGDGLVLLNYHLGETPGTEQVLTTGVLADHLRSVMKALKTTCKQVALTLGHEDSVVTHADLPQTSPADLRKMIKLSPKSYLGQDLPDHVFDVFYRSSGQGADTAVRRKRKSRVLVGATRRRVVEDLGDAAKLAGVQLVALVPGAVALTNAFRLVREESHPDAAALLDLGADHSTINIVQHGEVLLTREVALGAEKFADVLSPDGETTGEEDEHASPEEMQARLQGAILTFAREVDASAGFYTSQYERHISQLFVSGGVARSQMVLQMLESELTFSCEGWNLIRHLTTELPEGRVRELEYDMPQLVQVVGCGAGVLLDQAVRINLLAETLAAAEARRRDPVRRLGMAGVALVGLTVVWAGWVWWQSWNLQHMIRDTQAKAQEISKGLQRPELALNDRYVMAKDALYAKASDRVLFAPILSALQFVNAEGIQVQSLTLERQVIKEKKESVVGEPAEVHAKEQVVLNLVLRNYGDQEIYYRMWKAALMETPFFREHLREEEGVPVRVTMRSQLQPDPFDPEKSYSLYSVVCYFKERQL